MPTFVQIHIFRNRILVKNYLNIIKFLLFKYYLNTTFKNVLYFGHL